MKKTIINKTEQIRARAIEVVRWLPLDPVHSIKIQEVKNIRTLEQSAKMWAMLTDMSKQINWYGQKLTPEEWKDVLTAGLKQQKVVPGIGGGFVVIGARTSQMSIAEMSDVIEFAYAVGADHNVKWSEKVVEGWCVR